MFGRLVQKELLHHLLDFRFISVIALCVVLSALSVYGGGRNYTRHLQEYDAVSELTPLSQIIELEENSSTIDYPVIDSKGDFAGMLQFQAFRSVLSQNVVYPLVIAKDLLTTDVEPLLPTDTLSEALAKFGRHDFDCLPVMDVKNPRKAIGIVRRSDLMERYRQAGSALQRTIHGT